MDEGDPPSSRRRGVFISLEGVDGCGKTTQAALLVAALSAAGHRVVAVREPGGTRLGEAVRSLVLGDGDDAAMVAWAEVLLFVAARAQLVAEVILPALERGDVVVADRFVDSTLAYQGAGRGLGEANLRRLHHDACSDLWPDLTILLRVDERTAAARRSGARPDRMERALDGTGGRVAAAFDRIAREEPARVAVVDGAHPAEGVAREVVEVVLARIAALIAAPLP